MKKIGKIILRILIGLVCFVIVALGGVKLVDWVAFSAFYTRSEAVCSMPGSNDGLVQQGFDYVEESQTFLAVGYMTDGTAARVYVFDENGVKSYTQLLTADGKAYTKHTGGITHYGDYVYVTADDGGLDVFDFSDIMQGAESVKMLGNVPTYNIPAHCYVYNGYLFAGSFFIEEDYETPAHERITTPNGDQNTSIITVLKLDDNQAFGVDPTPKAVISTRRCVQGMCITDDGKIVLSTSYGLSPSQLFVYDTTNLPMTENYTFSDGENIFAGLPLYYLDSANVVEVIQTPPMAEELVYLDGKIYILNESACNKYIFGKFTSGYNLYAYSYEEE